MSEPVDMTTAVPLKDAAAEFLALRRIAVTGVSRTGAGHSANAVYVSLREHGYEALAVNPNAQTVEGDPAFANLSSIPGTVDAVVIATRPDRAAGTIQECIDLGIKHVWMHHGPAATSVSPDAVAEGRANGIRVIDGGCPLMFSPLADIGHRCMRGLFAAIGRLPRRV